MAATGTPTPNIGLRIPIGTDPASVDDINYNSNILDTKLGPVGSDSVQDQLDTLNGNIANMAMIKKVTITGTTDSQGLLALSAIPYGYVPVFILAGTGDVATFFNGSSSSWQPYVRMTNYDGVARESKQYSITVLCVYGVFNN